MKRNLIAFFIILVMLVQSFPVASIMLFSKAYSDGQGIESEIALSISLLQIDEDEVKAGKLCPDFIPSNIFTAILNEVLVQYYGDHSVGLYSKGYRSIHLPPPNLLS